MIDPEFFEETNEDIGPMSMLGYVIAYCVLVAIVAGLAMAC